MRCLLTMMGVLFCFAVPVTASDPNGLTAEEEKAGFEVLFSGRDLQGWQHSGNWSINDGAIERTSSGGGITYGARKVPDDFELTFQWKVARGSNSGVYYRPGQYEYQILDNKVHVDGKNPRTSAASLYYCMAPSEDFTKPVGQWNLGRIVCKSTLVQHWLNGRMVINFDYANPKWAWNVELLKKRGADLSDRGANLMLQDHGDPVWYRAIKLRSLGAAEKLDRTPVQPAPIPAEVLRAEAEKLERILRGRKRPAAR